MNAIGDVGIAIAIFFMVRDLGTTDYHAVFSTRPHECWAKGGDDGQLGGAAAAAGRGRQVGPDPAPHLASRRHGGPHPGQRADPRGHHGDGRRLPGRALRTCCSRTRPTCARWWRCWAWPTLLMAGVIALVQTDIKRIIAYSTMSQIGYMFAAVGVGDVLGRHVPPAHPRVLQGAAVPGRRHRHPRARQRAGRAADGRPVQGDAAHDHADVGGHDRADRVLAAVQGRRSWRARCTGAAPPAGSCTWAGWSAPPSPASTPPG